MDHYRAHGARGTFLAATCDHQLPTGQSACLVYIFPKYKLEKALECPTEMSALLKCSLSTSRAEVLKACAHARTGEYDIHTHMSLRQSYTSVWVTKCGSVLEGHKDFITGCGHTEHSLFVSGLLQKNFYASLPKGPLHSQPRKKPKAKAKAKRSEATKRMLGPPESKSHVDKVLQKLDVVYEHDIFPGMPVGAHESAYFHMTAADDDEDGLCLSGLVRGGRCSRKRTHGNYCKQHAHEHRKPDKQDALWSQLDDVMAESAERWESEQVAIALSLSVQENEDLKKKRQASRRKVEKLLREDGLEPVETQADGTCQFLAVLYSAGIALDPFRLRQQTVDYLRTLPGLFAAKIESRFPNFSAYLDTMSLPHTWGDELTLAAMAHLMLRPIEVVSDSEIESRRIFQPPPTISEECWGPKVTICHIGQNHFEATIPLEAGQPVASAAIKHEL